MLLSSLLAAADNSSSGGGGFQIVFLALIGLMMYVILIRPQRKRMREAQNLLASIAEGDEVITSGGIYGFVDAIESFGGRVLQGTCFYQQYAREIGEANGWRRLLSNSTKIVNILGGYGYQPALASMEACIASAIKGEIV